MLDSMASAAQSGKLKLVDGGRHRIVTSHIDNTVEGICLALERGRGGEAYYVFGDSDVTMSEFLASLFATRGMTLPSGGIPRGAAWVVATILEVAWAFLRRPGAPPINREMGALTGRPFLVSDRKARVDLGYKSVTTREAGLAGMARSANLSASRS